MPPAEPDRARAVELRRAALERAGYDSAAAAALARRLEIDLRDALALVRHGFPPGLAREMLERGERPVF